MEEIKLRLEEGVQMPQYESAKAVGFDVRAIKVLKAYIGNVEKEKEKVKAMHKSFINNRLKLRPGETVLFGTGIYADIPDNIELQVRPRSGTSLKAGIQVANSPGTIDPDYTGEIGIIIHNCSPHLNTLEFNTRIAQLVPKEVIRPALSEVEDITKETERGDKGFGSTGV